MGIEDFRRMENNGTSHRNTKRVRLNTHNNNTHNAYDKTSNANTKDGKDTYAKDDEKTQYPIVIQENNPLLTKEILNKGNGERLNKYLSNSGVCSRRNADKLIASGVVSINDEIILTLGTRVMKGDIIKIKEEELNPEKKIYLVLNKPKDTITTLADPQGRTTVIDIVRDACDERIYPVGRLDRHTTGILLLTNDGKLAARLTHPSFEVKKIYTVKLNRSISITDMQKITMGIELADGLIKADAVQYETSGVYNCLRITLHSGKNRVIRRIFEFMEYRVISLERISFAGITKRKLKQGKYRFLDPSEVTELKLITHKT